MVHSHRADRQDHCQLSVSVSCFLDLGENLVTHLGIESFNATRAVVADVDVEMFMPEWFTLGESFHRVGSKSVDLCVVPAGRVKGAGVGVVLSGKEVHW